MTSGERLNFLPDDGILDWSKLEAFADDELTFSQSLNSIYQSVENNVGKGENAVFLKRQIRDPTKLKEFADDNYKHVEKWQKVFKWQKSFSKG